MTKIINLFGGPGIGKSSIAAGLTYEMKKNHISCDNPYEFPKLLAWDNNGEAIKDQLYVLANQHRGIAKSYGKVDYIILDSPIILSLIYKNMYDNSESYPQKLYGRTFNKLILEIFNQYENININLRRNSSSFHNDKERYQSLESSLEIDGIIEKTLIKNKIQYHSVNVDNDVLNNIIKIIKTKNYETK